MGPFLAKLWCLEDVLSKTWNLLRVHSQNLQSVVTPSKMTLFVDFSLKMEIYMLSFQNKKKIERKYPETKKWHLVEVEAESAKIDQNYTFTQ